MAFSLDLFCMCLAAPKRLFKKAQTKAHRKPHSECVTNVPQVKVEGARADTQTASDSFVCRFCWDVGLFAAGSFRQAWDAQSSRKDYSYSTTWSQVQTSADESCQWCKILLSIKTEAMQQNTVQFGAGFRVCSGSNGETPRGVQQLRLLINGFPHSVYYIYTRTDDCAATVIAARPRMLQLKSPSACAMALTYITDCMRDHDCCPPPQVTALPTRVIDCSDHTKPKLQLGDGLQAPYLALSYVWGEDQPYCTTSDNLDTYLVDIDSAKLPQTIRDAIEITHAFGVRYLWVDALCILQDSKEDKVREIARMRSIFRNAYFTIIAASAQRVSEGFLQDRNAPFPEDVSLPFRCPDGEIGRMSLSPVWTQYDGTTEPVNQRAWCLEERLLSPRALVYASHTLQFHCQTAIINIGNAVCGPMSGQKLPDIVFRSDNELVKPLLLSEDRMLRGAWLDALGDYTRRSVTKPRDKLLAFAAISELFGRAWQTEYLAGLWRKTLIQDILWYQAFDTRTDRPEVYRAPSWSWAAVDGHIIAFSMDDRLDPNAKEVETCKIVKCAVTTTPTTFPFGAVRHGTLTLRAIMLRATWNPESLSPDLYLPANGHLDSTESPLDPVHIGSAYPDAVESTQEVWAVSVLWNNAEQYTAGLIVARSPDEHCYRRVGYFHTPDSASGVEWINEVEAQDIVLV